MKKLLTVFLVLVLLSGLAAGCGNQNTGSISSGSAASEIASEAPSPASSGESSTGETQNTPDNVVTIDIYVPGEETASSLDNTVGKYIADRFGLEFMLYGYPGDSVEKQGMMLAGGDYGGLVTLDTGTMIKNYIEAGALINLDDYKELLPDFYSFYEEEIPYWRQSSPDGGLYIWRCCAKNRAVDTHCVMVRTDVLEYYGWPQILSDKEWLAFLEQAIKDFPTSFNGEPTVGMAANMADEWFRLGSTTELYGTGEEYYAMANEPWLYNFKQKKVVDLAHEPAVKESLQFWNNLYKSGVLDPECLTDNDDAVGAKMADGRAIAAYYGTWNMKSANAALVEAGHPEMQFIVLPIQTSGQVERGEGRAFMIEAAGPTVMHNNALTVNCPDVERYLEFLNWCCTEEGVNIINNGLEDVHWYYDENGKRQLTELGAKVVSGEVKESTEQPVHGWCVPFVKGQWEDGQYRDLATDPEIKDKFRLSDRQKEAYAALGWENSEQWWIDHAVWYDGARGGLTTSAQPMTDTDIGRDYTKLKECGNKHIAGIVFSDDFESSWNAFLREWEMIDYEAVMQYMNDELDRMCDEMGIQ